MYIMPRPMLSVPSVAMKGGRPIAVISSPLVIPKATPTPRPAAMLTVCDRPESKQSAVTSPARPIAEPTDRSIPPVMMTITMPMLMIAVSEKARDTPIRLSTVRKYGVKRLIRPPTTRRAISTLTSRTCHSRANDRNARVFIFSDGATSSVANAMNASPP